MEGGMISVDKWGKGSQAYFLTHLHSDHTSGLSSSWSHGPLYCSRTTSKLFPLKFPDFNLSLLRVVQIGQWHRIILKSPSTASVEFIPIDAIHCPGSVMFLFRGVFGHVLYTGDFRWDMSEARCLSARNVLVSALDAASLDVLFLDNTYCNPTYCFPSRQLATQQVIEIIASHPEHDVIIGIDSLGKEDLLLQISLALNIKIWVWPERLQTLHLLGYPDIFTTRTYLTRVRAVPRYSFGINTLESLNKQKPTIGIMPSGLPWAVKHSEGKGGDGLSLSLAAVKGSNKASNGTRVDRNMRSVEKVHQYIFSVPYSDHSSFREIKDFVQLFKPQFVKGIVSISPWYVDPAYYLGHLLTPNQKSEKTSPSPDICEQVQNIGKGGKRKRRDFTGRVKEKRPSVPEVNFFGVRISRVSILRKISRGVRIVECDGSD